MTSVRNKSAVRDHAFLDAARDTILAVGWRRTTLTDVAKRAGTSRMTIYRRWPDMQTLLADLLVREWGGLVDAALAEGSPAGRDGIADAVVRTVAALRDNALFRRIVEVDPELLLPYLLDKRGRNQDHVVALLGTAIRAGQDDGSVRRGDPDLLAKALLLALHGFVVSAGIVPEIAQADLDAELTALVERYLRP